MRIKKMKVNSQVIVSLLDEKNQILIEVNFVNYSSPELSINIYCNGKDVKHLPTVRLDNNCKYSLSSCNGLNNADLAQLIRFIIALKSILSNIELLDLTGFRRINEYDLKNCYKSNGFLFPLMVFFKLDFNSSFDVDIKGL